MHAQLLSILVRPSSVLMIFVGFGFKIHSCFAPPLVGTQAAAVQQVTSKQQSNNLSCLQLINHHSQFLAIIIAQYCKKEATGQPTLHYTTLHIIYNEWQYNTSQGWSQ